MSLIIPSKHVSEHLRLRDRVLLERKHHVPGIDYDACTIIDGIEWGNDFKTFRAEPVEEEKITQYNYTILPPNESC